MPTLMDIVYDGRYLGKCGPTVQMWEYYGKVYAISQWNEQPFLPASSIVTNWCWK
jgi:hypothetical protein